MGYETETEQTVFAAEKGGLTMKKKIFAALAAAAMLCGCLTAPASAATDYKMGDVNMDGVVDITDAMITLDEYTWQLCENPCRMSDEELEIITIVPKEDLNGNNGWMFLNATFILRFYTTKLVDDTLQDQDIVTFTYKYLGLEH